MNVLRFIEIQRRTIAKHETQLSVNDYENDCYSNSHVQDESAKTNALKIKKKKKSNLLTE